MSAAADAPERLYIFGAGGFGREVAWLAEECWGTATRLTFLVDRPQYVTPPVNDIPVELFADAQLDSGAAYVVALGDPEARRAAVATCDASGLAAATLIHPRVEHSRWVDFGEGSLTCAGVILTTNIRVGEHVHVNLDCTIGHDASLGAFATLSPGVHVSGHVSIGERVFVGTGATIINGSSSERLTIGDGAIIAAGACVTKPVEPGALVAGVPAVRKK